MGLSTECVIPNHRRVLVPKFISYVKNLCPQPSNLLDVGSGLIEPLLKQHFKSYVGLDLHGKHDVIADAEHLPFQDEAFDVVTAWTVIEHLLNPYICLKEMVRVSSHLVILTTGYTQQDKDADPTHLYCWTPKTFKQLLSKLNHSVEVSITTGIMGVITKHANPRTLQDSTFGNK